MTTAKQRRVNSFKDLAAEIVRRDRGPSPFNLGQSIASALEKAYQQGVRAETIRDDDKLPLDYSDIPRRFRALFDDLRSSHRILHMAWAVPIDREHIEVTHDLSSFTQKKQARSGGRYKRSSAQGLEQIGLICFSVIDGVGAYRLTPLGISLDERGVPSDS